VTTPPSHWPDKALRVALVILAIAVMLHIAAQLIASVWPVLLTVGLVVLVGFVGWTIYQARRSRW
jgi:uncharacterized membrane protein